MANRRAKTNWLALTPSRKKEILRYFSRLKSPAARGRNLARAVHVLSGAAGRFMGRTWADVVVGLVLDVWPATRDGYNVRFSIEEW